MTFTRRLDIEFPEQRSTVGCRTASHPRRTNHQNRIAFKRTGFTIIECLIAIALLTVFTGMVIPVATKIQELQHEQALQQLAVTTLRNLAEEDLLQHKSETPELSSQVRQQFQDPRLEIKVKQAADGGEGRRVTLSLQWRTRTGQPSRSVQLSYWVFEVSAIAQPSDVESKQE